MGCCGGGETKDQTGGEDKNKKNDKNNNSSGVMMVSEGTGTSNSFLGDSNNDNDNNNNNNNKSDPLSLPSSPKTEDDNSSKNPLSGMPKRQASLSDISDLSGDDDPEAILDSHRAPEEYHPFSPARSDSSLDSLSRSTSSGSFTSSGGGGSGRGSSGLGLGAIDLGRQREEAQVDLVDEFFVWDDMKYDLARERARPALGPGTRTGAAKVFAGSTKATLMNTEGEGNNNNSSNNSSSSATSASAGSPTSSAFDQKVPSQQPPRRPQSPFVFNDFSIDEISKIDEVTSFFSAAAITKVAGLSPRHHNNNNNNNEAPSPRNNNEDAKSPRNSSSYNNTSGTLPSLSDENSTGGTTVSGTGARFGRFSPGRNYDESTSESGTPGGGRHHASPKLRTLGGNPEDIRNVNFSTLGGHTTRVKVLAVAPGEKEYVSCSSDDTSLVYADINTGRELGLFTNNHTDAVLHAVFSCCGKYLSSTSRDNTMVLWDVVTQKALLTYEHAKVVICSAFSRDSRFLVTGCQDKVCRLWEARRGRELGSFAGHEGIIIALAFSPDGTYCVSASSDRTLRKWSAIPQEVTQQISSPTESNKKNLNSASLERIGKQKGVMVGHEGIILSCTFTADGNFIVSNDERLVKVWRADNCVCHKTFHIDTTVRLRNLPTNKKLTWTLAAAAPGQYPCHFMAAANNRFLYVFNIENGDEEVSLYCKSPIYCLTAGPRSVALCGDAFGNVYSMKILNPYLNIDPPAPPGSRPNTPAVIMS